MTDTTTPAELVIPPAAVEAYFVCGCAESGIRAGYKPEALSVVVAAELRRMADVMVFAASGMHIDGRAEEQANEDADLLRARADELDPQS